MTFPSEKQSQKEATLWGFSVACETSEMREKLEKRVIKTANETHRKVHTGDVPLLGALLVLDEVKELLCVIRGVTFAVRGHEEDDEERVNALDFREGLVIDALCAC